MKKKKGLSGSSKKIGNFWVNPGGGDPQKSVQNSKVLERLVLTKWGRGIGGDLSDKQIQGPCKSRMGERKKTWGLGHPKNIVIRKDRHRNSQQKKPTQERQKDGSGRQGGKCFMGSGEPATIQISAKTKTRREKRNVKGKKKKRKKKKKKNLVHQPGKPRGSQPKELPFWRHPNCRSAANRKKRPAMRKKKPGGPEQNQRGEGDPGLKET